MIRLTLRHHLVESLNDIEVQAELDDRITSYNIRAKVAAVSIMKNDILDTIHENNQAAQES